MRIVVGISGASGIILGLKTVLALVKNKIHVDFICTRAAIASAREELGPLFSFESFFGASKFLTIHDDQDCTSPIASGSVFVDGMIIVPCSMNTLASIRAGIANTLLLRAADVTLKERRPFVLVPRETPLSAIHLENMAFLSRLGITIAPPMPQWYFLPSSMAEMEDGLVARFLQLLKIPLHFREWEPRKK